MNYHDLKIIHIFLAALTIAISTALFYGGRTKARQIAFGLSCVFLFLTGFTIMGRFGIKHSPPWPIWINVKIGVWAVYTIATPIIVKRFPTHAKKLFVPWMALALVAIMMAVYKPLF